MIDRIQLEPALENIILPKFAAGKASCFRCAIPDISLILTNPRAGLDFPSRGGICRKIILKKRFTRFGEQPWFPFMAGAIALRLSLHTGRIGMCERLG